MQGQLAAVSERLEALETGGGRRNNPQRRRPEFDWEDMGMWSLVLTPASRGIEYLHTLAAFFAKDESRTPSSVVVRRLCLDVSFLVFVLGLFKLIWLKSGVRRREVLSALIVLWRAVFGIKPPRALVDRGV